MCVCVCGGVCVCVWGGGGGGGHGQTLKIVRLDPIKKKIQSKVYIPIPARYLSTSPQGKTDYMLADVIKKPSLLLEIEHNACSGPAYMPDDKGTN